jgi:hypothetical protein
MAQSTERNLRRINRRQVIAGAVALGVAGSLALGRRPQHTAAATYAIPGAGLTQLATYAGWRRTWDLVVPLSVDRAFPRLFLLYDRAAGEAKLISVDATGAFRELRQFSGWRRSWDSITASGFPRTLGVFGLIAYDRAAGTLSTLQIDQFGSPRELQSYPTWRKSWTLFVPVGIAGFVAYDRAAGYGTLFSVDGSGVVREVRSYNDWRATWDIVTVGPFTTATMPSGDLLFYDRGARHAEGLTFLGTGQIVPFASYDGWRQTWTSIQGDLFLLRGFTSSGTANVVFFDQGAQELEFLDLGANSLLTSLLLTPTAGGRAWTLVTAIGPDLLFLYDRANGVAGFYVTDRAVPPTPTPSPVPPPPTPTPVPPKTGSVTVRVCSKGGAAPGTPTRAPQTSPRPRRGGDLSSPASRTTPRSASPSFTATSSASAPAPSSSKPASFLPPSMAWSSVATGRRR